MSAAKEVDGHIKRIACQVYTQLPDDKREALLVLRYVRQIVFCLGEDWETISRSAPILPFASDLKGRAEGPTSLRIVRPDRLDTANQE